MNSVPVKRIEQTIQRAVLIIALIAVAHAIKPFSVKSVVRQLFRTTQSLAFVLPGAAVCTLERADYVAAVLSGGFGQETLPGRQINPAAAELAKAGMAFNPEHGLPEPQPQAKSRSGCPLEKQRQERMQQPAMSAQSRSKTAFREKKTVSDERDETRRFGHSILAKAATRQHHLTRTEATEFVAVVDLPQIHHAEVPVIVPQESLVAVEEYARTLTAQIKRLPCPPVPPQASPVRKAVAVVNSSRGQQTSRSFSVQAPARPALWQTEPALKVKVLFITNEINKTRKEPLKLQCTKDGQTIKC